MAHITCAFCRQYQLECANRICAHTRRTPITRAATCRDLAHALCDLCRNHALYCGNDFCSRDAEQNPESLFVYATCDICDKNGQSCSGKSFLDRMMDILNDPPWNYILADDLFTSYLIGEVEAGKWDDFLNHLTLTETGYFNVIPFNDNIYDDLDDYVIGTETGDQSTYDD